MINLGYSRKYNYCVDRLCHHYSGCQRFTQFAISIRFQSIR